ncbi:TetR family transcriptional regulator [Pseudactinotalea suaedae]|uniref:TetR family transcriptional regulator n=1 Tax=Pseudactinotalea suaedae TaxID=1524924 RepID=UPI0012E1F3A9|nr:TetR family transcriptional regulator [Pseudactinotalea suaedae]
MTTSASTRDGQASRERLLNAATAEFAQYGLAGARVDRIAAAAGVNKAQSYAWFGNKDDLFALVFARHLAAIAQLIRVDGFDLPDYVVRLYDFYLEDPTHVRLATWMRLERVPAGLLSEQMNDHLGPMLESIALAQAQGVVTDRYSPAEAYQLAIGLSLTWSPASVLVAAAPDDDESEHQRRRAILRETAQRTFAP